MTVCTSPCLPPYWLSYLSSVHSSAIPPVFVLWYVWYTGVLSASIGAPYCLGYLGPTCGKYTLF